ncbi:MAG: hypothetical protein WD029_06555, partial [Microthrixaceae bacterium]
MSSGQGNLPSGFTYAVEAAAAAEASSQQLAMLEQHLGPWKFTLERLLFRTEEDLVAIRRLNTPEREQVISDFEAERDRLESALNRLVGDTKSGSDPVLLESAGEIRLQASWAAGRLVVWAAGPGTAPANAADLAARLENAGVLASGWTSHPPVRLPSGTAAPALALPIGDAIGWLANVGAGHENNAIGSSVTWLGRVAVWAVRLVAAGQVVPIIRNRRRGRQQEGSEGRTELSVRWGPALLGTTELNDLAAAMPGPVTALERTEAKPLTLSVLSAITHAIVSDAASKLTFPASPPDPNDLISIAETVLTRMDGASW